MSLAKDLKDIQLGLEIVQHHAKQSFRDRKSPEIGCIIVSVGKILNQISTAKIDLVRDNANKCAS